MPDEKKFTEPIKCGHCQNITPMEICAEYSTIRGHEDYQTGMSWDSGSVYQMALCPACEGLIFRTSFWHDAMDPSEVRYSTLYTSGQKALRVLPAKIEKAYQAAQKVRNIDANAYGVLLGRVLEFICEDRNATGSTLDKKLKSLADAGEIPKKLVSVASGLRKLRNIGAHANLGELTEQELPVLDNLTHAIVDYVYSAPHLAEEAEKLLARLTTKRSGVGKQSGNPADSESSE